MLSLQRLGRASLRGWFRSAILSGFVGGLIANTSPLANAQSSTTLQAMPTLSTASPQDLQSRLQVYNLPPKLLGTIAAQLQLQYHANPAVRITTEPNTDRLMILAPTAVHERITQQLSALMQQNNITVGELQRPSSMVNQRSYALKNLSWRELEDAIVKLGGARVVLTTNPNGEVAQLAIANSKGMKDVVQIDRRLNQVTLVGAGQGIEDWAQVVYSLDQGQADRTKSTHVVPLAPAEPRKVRQAFQLVAATLQQGQNDQTEERFDLGGDQQATAMGTLEDLGSGSGLFGDVQIEFLEEIDLVIIRGSKDDVKRTLEVIEKIKKQAQETQPEVEVYTLKHANGQAVEVLVNELYEEIYLPRQGSVSIKALVQPNALLIVGRKEVVATVIGLIEKIDKPLDPEHQLKVRRLSHASAVDIEDRIRQFFVEDPGRAEEIRQGIGTRARVVADYRSNSLIIQASPREMVEIDELITKLDSEEAATENSVQVFRLMNTLAEDLQDVMEGIIGGQATGGDTSLATPPSGRLSLVTVDGEKVVSGVLAGVIITADPSVNALVVRAPSQSMGLIAKLIKELDKLPSAEARIKVFQLENGDATTMTATLQALFGLSVTAGQGAQANFLNNFNQAALTTGGEGSLVQLQIAAEARTNSVIASGSKSDLDVIEALVMRLDEDVIESRRTDVIWLQNADSSEVATALDTYFNDLSLAQQQLNNGINQILSAQELVRRQVFIVPDVATNSVLVSASPDNFQVAISLIEKLDRRPPMISIQVLIAEIQLDDGFELGAEWGIQDGLLFDRQSATGGTLSSPVFNLGNTLTGPSGAVGLTQNVAGQALSSFGVGRSNAAGQGGVVLSASSEAVGVLIRALQTSNRIQILNRPMLTTIDNREATTLVGASVPRVTGVTQASAASPQQVITTPEDVGLQLTVFPRVSPDGLILMRVGVENSSLGDPNAGIPIGFGQNGEVIRSPIINTTRADTTVSAYSGQTVVFAGLISKNRNTARSQIPILGSLPLIGPAFRFDVESEQRRELMVVLTPRIIQTDEDYETLKHVETSRMSWCLADVLNMHGDVGLSGGNGLWGPATTPTMYPDSQPHILQDRAPRNPQPGYGGPAAGYGTIEAYPNMTEGSIIDSVPMPPLDVGANNSTKPLIRQASYGYTPAAGN